MKHITPILPVVALLLLAGCNGDKKQIQEVAYGYVMATGNFQIDDAMPFASKETRESTIPMMKYLLEHTDTAFLQMATPATATIDRVEVYDDTALAFYTKTNPIGTTSDTLVLIKEEGQWLVYFPIEFPAITPDDENITVTTESGR